MRLVVQPNSQALVRVEFDETSRVGSVCVDNGVGFHARVARRDVATKLDAIRSLRPGADCMRGSRLDFNRYRAKYAEINEALNRCDASTRKRGFEAQSECLLADGFQLLESPQFELLAPAQR